MSLCHNLNNYRLLSKSAREQVHDYCTQDEGFWRSNSSPELPLPVPTDTSLSEDVCEKLEALQRLINRNDYDRIGMYGNMYNVSVYGQYRAYLGSSVCRLCSAVNGSEEYLWFDATSKTRFRWPSGYLHYIRCHGVIPSSHFVEALQSLDLDTLERHWDLEIDSISSQDLRVLRDRDTQINVWRITSGLGAS